MRLMTKRWAWFAVALVALGGCTLPPPAPIKTGLDRIEHIVVIYAENRSFDNLYGLFPGANGIANATPAQYTQMDRDGRPLATLPPVWKGKDPDPAFPRDLPNRPYRIDAPPINLPLSTATRDLIHEFYRNQEQIDGGRNDRFVAASDAGALTRASPLWATTAVIVTYDENGGFWDHVAPPAGDRWGPGTRIPALIISPFARRGYIDHTQYDTTSIIKFITRRFGLQPLPGARAQMGDLTAAFDFSQ
jgi:phospholipase C